MIVCVDFDGTLALGNYSWISLLRPNTELIKRITELKATVNPTIKIVTARGSKGHLSKEEKDSRYKKLIEDWLIKYNVPFDEISFNKEYANLYIDDMTIGPTEAFTSSKSYFTNNSLIFTEKTVIKSSKSALFEFEWYKKNKVFKTPEVLFCNDETIITERIYPNRSVNLADIVIITEKQKAIKDFHNFPWQSYLDNIPGLDIELPEQKPTMFHGDLSTTNVLCKDDDFYLIDSNYKYIFGNWMTDLGKMAFSLMAYENKGVDDLINAYGNEVLSFAYAEGLRVAKYKDDYCDLLKDIKQRVSAIKQ